MELLICQHLFDNYTILSYTNGVKPEKDYNLRRAIRNTIQIRGMNQAELCRRAGICKSQLSRYLACKHDMLGGSVDRLRSALGLLIVDSVPDEEE